MTPFVFSVAWSHNVRKVRVSARGYEGFNEGMSERISARAAGESFGEGL